jgi:hypothetical protein
MHDLARARRAAGAFLIPPMLLLVACGSSSVAVISGTPTATTPRATPLATATPFGPPPHAFAWTQHDGAGLPQVWASVNGAAPTQITQVPAGAIAGCGSPATFGLPVFSPDLSHVVAVASGGTCVDGPVLGTVSVITVAGAATAAVPGVTNLSRANMRTTGWVNNNTIFFISDKLYTYTLGAGAPTAVAGVSNPVEAVVRGHMEAVVRGHTLFYAQGDTANHITTFTLHQYDFNMNAVLPASIALGQIHMCVCSSGDYAVPGWDVSHDGTHVVYQQTTTDQTIVAGITSSHIIYADASGGNATQIAQTLNTTKLLLRMQLSPNGQLVAIDGVTSTAPVVSASVSSPGLAGDPNYHTYTPDGVGFSVWKWDNSSFWAATKPDSSPVQPFDGAVDYYQVGNANAAVGVAGGYNPWYTLP